MYDLETLRFLDVNEVACQKYGYARDEFLSMTIRDLRPPEDVPAVEASVREMPVLSFNAGIWRHRLKDGSKIYVEITSHPILYCATRARLVCPVDVTQRLLAEQRCRNAKPGFGGRSPWPAWPMS